MSIQVISFNCVLKNKAGHLISSTFNRDVLSDSGGENAMLSGLAKGMHNLVKGERRSIALRAEEAYGLYEPSKVILYPRTKLPPHLQVGQLVTITGKSGVRREYRVMQFHDDMASLDGNHPLAGQDLIFEIETLAARDATSEEIASSARAVVTQVLH